MYFPTVYCPKVYFPQVYFPQGLCLSWLTTLASQWGDDGWWSGRSYDSYKTYKTNPPFPKVNTTGIVTFSSYRNTWPLSHPIYRWHTGGLKRVFSGWKGGSYKTNPPAPKVNMTGIVTFSSCFRNTQHHYLLLQCGWEPGEEVSEVKGPFSQVLNQNYILMFLFVLNPVLVPLLFPVFNLIITLSLSGVSSILSLASESNCESTVSSIDVRNSLSQQATWSNGLPALPIGMLKRWSPVQLHTQHNRF